jgi:hypothetical protein
MAHCGLLGPPPPKIKIYKRYKRNYSKWILYKYPESYQLKAHKLKNTRKKYIFTVKRKSPKTGKTVPVRISLMLVPPSSVNKPTIILGHN